MRRHALLQRKWGTEMNELFVVIEWNQASGEPRVADDEVYSDEAEVRERAAWCAQQTAAVGRRERFTVARIEHVEDDDE